VLVMQIPAVLRSDLYALAALIGAAIVVGGHVLGIQAVPTTIVGGLACFALRYMAIRHGWHLPHARRSGDEA
jgi:uncharacterized membrane protein YeiH